METCSADERGKLQNEYEGRSEASDFRPTTPNTVSFVLVEPDKYMVLRWPNAKSPAYTATDDEIKKLERYKRGRANYVKIYATTEDDIQAQAREDRFGYVKETQGVVCRGVSTCEYDFDIS